MFKPTHFLFDPGISKADQNWIVECHAAAYHKVDTCKNLLPKEINDLQTAYSRNVHHSLIMGGSDIARTRIHTNEMQLNIARLREMSDIEVMQTLIHEMMHCAGYNHPIKTLSDKPNDRGPYYGSAPLRAELCVAGRQSLLGGIPTDNTGNLFACSIGPNGDYVLEQEAKD
jgi:hypothetical protein